MLFHYCRIVTFIFKFFYITIYRYRQLNTATRKNQLENHCVKWNSNLSMDGPRGFPIHHAEYWDKNIGII